MKRSSAYVIMVILVGILGVVTCTSDPLPRQLLKRAEEDLLDKRRTQNKNSHKHPIDLTKIGYYAYGCYDKKEVPASILLDDCNKLQEELRNNTQTIVCKPGEQRYIGHKTCAVFLGVANYSKHSYSIKAFSLNDTIPGVEKNCHKNKTAEFYGGRFSFAVPENINFYKNNPNTYLTAPVVTALFPSPDMNKGKSGGKERAKKGKKKGKKPGTVEESSP
ncbi:hypothetical protein BY996DRAFT_7038043 [Phakopsora pachyrhizi]|uniref:Expressed protein n=1 Tax=Phakopsora pachyrhizi TaxID=170000 RepID=A0AAV0ASH4_PHAPC|nr:hypothetical protein BY996DRAFT_7038043 [Phakopsora pachyrhizi]CAH7672445.1 expressed protein [Phakopsora pachyrhizi]